ncbi:ATP-dependent DNA helicase RecG [Robiginitalea sp. M366]|uniref:ATP-dependent DNA helicase RecG n=1 Tax=Robiginitalea aestuariiviva TaxID=3036903 RepID=UPI00240E419A|nr:ATP-dependent DNA helicase RecG [Robiginitalea aestuariiviva]MDG1572844.1 ATP-dependent DNA helicase RecG [Robiginitalea aestuariiviva]
MHPQQLHTDVTYLKGVGPGRARLLRQELGIETYQDLLYFFPNRYIDKTRFYTIAQLERNSSEVQIVGQVVHLKTVQQKKGSRLVATFRDATGEMELVWFRSQQWFRDRLKLGEPYVVYGRVNWYNGVYSIAHPELELLREHEQKPRLRMQPVYPSTEKLGRQGVTNRLLSQWVAQLLGEVRDTLTETLPRELRETLGLMGKQRALIQIHFPDSQKHLAGAQARLKFEELFYIQLALLAKKQQRKRKIKGFPFAEVGSHFNTFYDQHLPFELTPAQKRVVREIRADLGSNAQMNRLLQGDVGSGKTIVAVLAMLLALDNGYQACLVAPTEILAQQHYRAVRELLEPMEIGVELLTGSVKEKDRKPMLEALASGDLPFLIGTHAVLEERVRFHNLGLAIVDEQHRFGVAQRARLWKKNTSPPHVLVMTATPIPRTLAMSLYGDLDISVIDTLPPGRKPVRTVWRSDADRLKVFRFMKDEIAKGRQVYVVYPLIQESEALDYKDLMDGYESISREFPQPQYQVSIVHGQMKPEDKDFEMQRFAEGKTQIMVATTVIEVGVNVPNASVMVIESAERFGLSQLHQLRGRVGRGADQSYCILMGSHKLSEDAQTRLQTMVRTNDGFEIAETDLRLRGPGDLMGTQQSGILSLKIADVVKDGEWLRTARHHASALLQADPVLTDPAHSMVREKMARMEVFKSRWDYIS